MNPLFVLSIIVCYFLLLAIISWVTSRNANTNTFFTANRKSPWYLVAFGMVGASLSGVTFISVPGEVGNSAFSYLQFILGNVAGYWLVAMVLLPLYYKLNLVSIYSFLEKRFGFFSYKTGAFFFLVSKLIGAAFRFYLVAIVLQIAFFDSLNIPFYVTVILSILLIWVYTFKGGIKTIVWTDTLQTLFLITAVVFTIFAISKTLNRNLSEIAQDIYHHPYSRVFNWDWKSGNNFFKQFFSGVFMTIVMTGMDQDMMQKNLTCKNLKESQKNMVVFSFSFFITVALFLSLGTMLYVFAESNGIRVPENTDNLYPMLAINNFGIAVGIAFLLGITSAAYSSIDSALTALTTSFCFDFVRIGNMPENKKNRIKKLVHISFSGVLVLVILLFKALNNDSVVNAVFTVAGYTYGPILGLFIFGMYNKKKVKDRVVPYIGFASPVISYLIASNSEFLFNGYTFGFEVLILNGVLTFIGLLIFTQKEE